MKTKPIDAESRAMTCVAKWVLEPAKCLPRCVAKDALSDQ
jgi:hypothetical protein